MLLQRHVTSELTLNLKKYNTAHYLGSVACRIALMNGFSIRDLGTEGAMYADVDLKMLSMELLFQDQECLWQPLLSTQPGTIL